MMPDEIAYTYAPESNIICVDVCFKLPAMPYWVVVIVRFHSAK